MINHDTYIFNNPYVAAAVVMAHATKPSLRVTERLVNSVYEIRPEKAIAYVKLPISLVGKLRTGGLTVISIDEC